MDLNANLCPKNPTKQAAETCAGSCSHTSLNPYTLHNEMVRTEVGGFYLET